MRTRYYAPSLGRFVSRDPIGFAGGINLYAYCYGDPINYWDPSGTDGIFGVPAGTVVGAGGYFLFTFLSGGNPVIGALGGAAAGAAWSYFVDHKDIQTSLADGFTGALVSNGLDDVLIAGRAYFNYSSNPPAEAASEPAAAAEEANSETLCRLRAKLDDPQVRREIVNNDETEGEQSFLRFKNIVNDDGITGYTKHGINQAISRNGVGVHPSAILDTIKNPLNVTFQPSTNTYKFIGNRAVVILNQSRKIVTVWARFHGNTRMGY